MFKNLLSKIVDIENVEEKQLDYLYSLYMYFIERDDKYKEILEYSRKDTNLSSEILDLLYKENINSSVSRLEAFKKCPFSYYRLKNFLPYPPERHSSPNQSAVCICL